MSRPNEIVPVIIRKKKVAGHGHHGGAWKVAYADFVTAMMALFIVLWLMNSSADVKKAVAGYFQDPSGPGKATGSGQAGLGEGLSIQQKDMEKLKEKVEAAFRKVPSFQKEMSERVQMVVTGEGLRIEFMETDEGLFFPTGSATPTSQGTLLLSSLAHEVGQLENSLLIEGHTDSHPFSANSGYGNWELSADRANAARRVMDKAGLKPNQVGQVRGYADQRLRDRNDPTNAKNRRISIVVRYNNTDQEVETDTKPANATAEAKHAPTSDAKPASEASHH